MNKLQLTVLYIVFSTAPVGLAMASPLLGAATPVQSYQSAQSSSQADKQINSSSEFDKVKQIMAKAKQEVQEGKVAPISQLKVPVTTVRDDQGQPKTTVKPLQPVSTANDSKVAAELESQMNQLNQAALQYQQATNQRIESLQQQNSAIQNKLGKLTQAMLLINQQLSSMSSQHGIHSVALPKATPAPKISFDGILKYVAFTLVALLAVMLGFLISRQRKG